jgi:hypothetical protein
MIGFILLLMWKNKKLGFTLKHRSLSLGKGEEGIGRIVWRRSI